MIKCNHCEEDNMIGVIFCRSCGKKIELDNITPDDLRAGTATEVTKKVGGVIRTLISVAVLIVILGLLIGLFLAPSMPEVNGLNEQDHRAARRKLLRGGQLDRHELSDMARYVAFLGDYKKTTDADADEDEVLFDEANSGALIAKDIMAFPMPPDKIKFIGRFRLWGKLNVHLTIVYQIEVTEDDGLTATPYSGKFGKIPMPGTALRELAVDDRMIVLLTERERIDKLHKNTFPKYESIDVDSDVISIDME